MLSAQSLYSRMDFVRFENKLASFDLSMVRRIDSMKMCAQQSCMENHSSAICKIIIKINYFIIIKFDEDGFVSSIVISGAARPNDK